MTDFVGENSGQFIVAFDVLKEAVVDVNVASREGEGVDVFAFDEFELVIERAEALVSPKGFSERSIGDLGHFAADSLDTFEPVGVRASFQFLVYFGAVLFAEFLVVLDVGLVFGV